jgi:hypothetical protein
MRNTKAKEIRSIIPPTDPVSRRNYRRIKKNYSKLSEKAKPLFLLALRDMLYASKEELEGSSV